jgi:hypothetical protein
MPLTALNLPRVLPWHSGKSSPSVRFLALGEEFFPVSRFPGSSSPSVALGEGFPECFWLFPECLRHSGKQVAPVVMAPTSSPPLRQDPCHGDGEAKEAGVHCAAVMRCFDMAKIFVKVRDGGSGVVAFRL